MKQKEVELKVAKRLITQIKLNIFQINILQLFNQT